MSEAPPLSWPRPSCRATPWNRAFARAAGAARARGGERTDASFPLFREARASASRERAALGRRRRQPRARLRAEPTELPVRRGTRRARRRARRRRRATPDGRVRDAYYRGTLATETGEARAASALEVGPRDAIEAGLSVLERNAIERLRTPARASSDASVRRSACCGELETRRRRLTGRSACEKAEEWPSDLGFGGLLANEQALADDAAPARRRSHAWSVPLAVRAAASDRYLRTAALGNLALAALQRSEPVGRSRFLAQARHVQRGRGGPGAGRRGALLERARRDASRCARGGRSPGARRVRRGGARAQCGALASRQSGGRASAEGNGARAPRSIRRRRAELPSSGEVG